MSSNRRVQVSAASRKLTRNRLSALPKKGDGIPQVLQAEEPQVAGRCSYERECPLATAEGGDVIVIQASAELIGIMNGLLEAKK